MKSTPRSRLLLLELVCDLLLFALCALVCVSLLVRAKSMSRRSAELTQAVYLAQSAAETGRRESYTTDGYEVRVGRDSEALLYEVVRDGRSLYSLRVEVAP